MRHSCELAGAELGERVFEKRRTFCFAFSFVSIVIEDCEFPELLVEEYDAKG